MRCILQRGCWRRAVDPRYQAEISIRHSTTPQILPRSLKALITRRPDESPADGANGQPQCESSACIPPQPPSSVDQARLPTLSPFDSGQGLALAEWFAEEVQPHGAQLKSYLRSAFPSVRDIDDVVQESYLRIWRTRTAQPIRSAKAFLFEVARRLAIDFTRHQARSPIDAIPDLASLAVMEGRPGVAEAVSTKEEIAWLARPLDACRNGAVKSCFSAKSKAGHKRKSPLSSVYPS